MSTKNQDVSSLFAFARNWFSTYEGQQIPSQDWEAAKRSFSDEDNWVIYQGDSACNGVGLDFIPVLAAISLGKTCQALLAVCVRHNLQPFSLKEFVFSEAGKQKSMAVFGKDLESTLTHWDVCNKVIQAISMSDSYARNFPGKLDSAKNTLRFSCLLSDREEFWPVTELRRVYENPFEERYEQASASDIDTFLNNGVDLSAYSNERVLQLIGRSGNLLGSFDIELGIPNAFFKDLFSLLHTKASDTEFNNLMRLAEAINSVENQETIDHLSTLIISSLSGAQYYTGMEGAFTIKSLHTSLDPVKYARVFDSTVLRTCAVSSVDLQIMRFTAPDDLSAEHHKELLTNPGGQLFNLLQELSSLAPQDYREPHFRALSRIVSGVFSAPSFDSIDLNAVVQQTLIAMDTYRSAHHVDELARETQQHKESASKHVAIFISYLANHMDIDYPRFSNITSESRLLLAAAGFEIKKIPNLTRQESGRVLSDQLGL